VFDRAALKGGESILIQGGTSGIGVTAIQMAKAFGATVFATAGSDDKCAACLKLGADHAINYKTQDFADEIKRITGAASAAGGVLSNAQAGGVNVILDMVAGSYVAKEVECLAEDGRLVIIAVQGGLKAEFNAGLVLRRRLQITGSTLRPRSVAFKAAIAQNLKQHVWPLLEAEKIKPILYKSFAPAQAAAAHTLMESNQHIGKIVLDWSQV
jgi:NADPH:quinone reductase